MMFPNLPERDEPLGIPCDARKASFKRMGGEIFQHLSDRKMASKSEVSSEGFCR
jgi:hypothetical protein